MRHFMCACVFLSSQRETSPPQGENLARGKFFPLSHGFIVVSPQDAQNFSLPFQ